MIRLLTQLMITVFGLLAMILCLVAIIVRLV